MLHSNKTIILIPNADFEQKKNKQEKFTLISYINIKRIFSC